MELGKLELKREIGALALSSLTYVNIAAYGFLEEKVYKMKWLDLISGTASVGKVAIHYNFEVISLPISEIGYVLFCFERISTSILTFNSFLLFLAFLGVRLVDECRNLLLHVNNT